MRKLKDFKIDVPVLLIFFCRPDTTAQVFEEIRKARPSKLFLYQDGPRSNNLADVDNIKKCRNLIENNIDWNCEVFRNYQDKNVGCNPSTFNAHKWAFSYVDKCIILEDDCVPSQSFFPYCKELLDKYEFDERINIICGMNNVGITTCEDSYFFSHYISIWGWATWKRNADEWEADYRWLDNRNAVENIEKKYSYDMKHRIPVWQRHKDTGRTYFESMVGSHTYFYHQLNIVPTYNMITNVGLTADAVHTTDSIVKVARAIRGLFFAKRYEIEFPLKHPKYVVENMDYYRKYRRLMLPGTFTSYMRRFEGLLYRLFPFFGK